MYSDCEITPSSSSAPALTGGCHGWHEAGSYPVIDDDDALWNCGNLAAGAQAWAAALAREISNGLWAPASPPSGFQRDGERASTGRAGPHRRVGHGARSAHALTASSFSMNWNGAGAGQRPAHRQPDETPSTPMKRDRAGAGQRPAHRRGPVLRKGPELGQGGPRLVNHAPRRPLPPTLAGGCHGRHGVGRGRDARRSGPTPRCPRVHAARSSR